MEHEELARTLRLAASGSRPHLSARAREAFLACDDHAALARLALEHRAAPWLAAALQSDPEASGHPGARHIAAAGASQVFDTLQRFSEMTRVVGELNRLDIPVVVLKGPGIAERFYPDPGLRPYGDVDLLIHEADLARVGEVLTARGYIDKNEHTDPHPHRLHECHGVFQRIFINEPRGQVVEVHLDHLQIGLEPVSMDEIWSRAAQREFGRARAAVLEDHDLFVQLCVHLQRHGYERLIWLKDLDLMVRAGVLDWATVERKAAAEGCLGAVSYALWLLPQVLRTPLPREAARLAKRQGLLSRQLFKRAWPVARIRNLAPQRQWRFRRLVQFAPETGLVRGGLPGFLTSGRRIDKLRVLAAGARNSLR